MRIVRRLVVAALTGALMVAGAWAGVGFGPVPGVADPPAAQIPGTEAVAPASVAPAEVEDSGLRVGASKVSLHPRPDDYDAVWEKEDCGADPDHVADIRSPFPVNPNCLYIWGVGPGTPITDFDTTHGLWSRSVAVSDGEETIVLTMLDAFSYFAFYDRFCEGCGALELAEELGDELGFDPAGFFLQSTHSHAAPDTIGSGGGVAQWYMDQIADSIRASVTQAVENMRPATIEAGEELARRFNNQRRDTYFSAEDPGLSWFRAVGADDEVIATVGAYAAHPVTFGSNGGVAHPDWPGLFVSEVEQRFGGLGFLFQTGLGNMSATSPIGPRNQIGIHLANMMPAVGEGMPVEATQVDVARKVWNQPYTNAAIAALGATGIFDRPMEGPAALTVGRDDLRTCVAASPISVRTVVSAAQIGPLVITGGPGELFSNLTNTIKERNADGVTLPLAQINDGLGYIMQEFEADYVYGQRTVEYEETFGSACFGEAVLEYTLDLLAGL